MASEHSEQAGSGRIARRRAQPSAWRDRSGSSRKRPSRSIANFASYNKTYGALGGVIVCLVWLWVSNIAILLGAEFNAELERERQIQAGQPAEDEPPLNRATRASNEHPDRAIAVRRPPAGGG